VGLTSGYLLKYSPDGALLWARAMETSDGYYAEGLNLAVGANGNVFVIGAFRNDLTQPVLANPSGTQYSSFLLTYAPDGTVVRALAYAGLWLTAISVDAAGAAYLAAWTQSNTLSLPPGITRLGSRDGLVFKVDAAGSAVWARNFGGAGAEVDLKDIAVSEQGRLYVTGAFWGGSLTSPSLALNNFDALVIALEPTGTIAWARKIGEGTAVVRGNDVSLSPSGDLYLTGLVSTGDLPSLGVYRAGTIDGLTMRFDADGTPTWTQSWGGRGNIDGRSIRVDGHGNVVVAATASICCAGMSVPITTGADNGWFLMKRTAPFVDPPALSASSSVVTSGTTATLGGTVSTAGGATVTARGVVYLNPNVHPTTGLEPRLYWFGSSSVTVSGTTGSFTTGVTGLTPGATYRSAAYVTTVEGTRYGPTVTFTTPSNVTTLSALTLSAGTLSPVFASGTTSYTASVGSGTTSITVTPTVTQAQATVVHGGDERYGE
jgi:hypothetical protein